MNERDFYKIIILPLIHEGLINHDDYDKGISLQRILDMYDYLNQTYKNHANRRYR